MPRQKMEPLPYYYKIHDHEGRETHVGPTSPFLNEAVIALYEMCSHGENGWTYSLYEVKGDKLLVTFKRVTLGVQLVGLSLEFLPPRPPLPKLPFPPNYFKGAS